MGGARSSRKLAKRIVGIDLGTSHTVVAWTDVDDAAPHIFRIRQQITATESEARDMLPSCLYAPLASERPEPELETAQDEAAWIPGEHARRRGAEVSTRFVASAKSWLCHGAADRHAPILPYGADEESEQAASPRISPVDASAQLLMHIRRAWDEAHADHPLADQEVVLTVPASFDEVARELTIEAATQAGLHVRLLEEPQAAFYDFMGRDEERALDALADATPDGGLALIVDVGGGTTDLSLIRVGRSPEGDVSVSRVAVGRHLLLGGDNMDLALAHLLEPRMTSEASRLAPRQFAELTLACRTAKERLLGHDPPEEVRVTVLGRGSQLLGGTLSAKLTRAEVEQVVLEGFLPMVTRSERVSRARGGLVAFGLPYERDVKITSHMATFFARHGGEVQTPHAILLNGGVFRAWRIEDRVVEVVESWGDAPIERLPLADPDLAVARGAVAYGLALRGRGTRIEAGAAHGYFVGLGGDAEETTRAICIVPRGAKEGAHHVATGRTLALLVGRPVRFDLYTSDDAIATEAGQVVTVDLDRFDALPPLTTRLSSPGGSAKEELEVLLEGELTAVGTLDLACVEAKPPAGEEARRFRLAFQLRDSEKSTGRSEAPPSRAATSRRSASLGPAKEAVHRVFGKTKQAPQPREVKGLVRELERLLGERSTWTTETARALADELLERHRGRKRTLDHERIFWQLTGFCLRPGFGHPGDEERVALIAPSFSERLAFPKETRTWQQFWIAWRRISGGLIEADQLRLRNETDPFIAPSERKLKKPKGAKPEALADLLDLSSSLERVPAARRSELGGWILEKTWTDRDPRLWAAVGRIGARVPAYASVHHVVGANVAERWLDHLLREKWADVPTAPRAAVQLARVTGDRARDVTDRTRETVAKRLTALGVNPRWIQAVRELVEVEEDDQTAFFGEGLPVGLRLLR